MYKQAGLIRKIAPLVFLLCMRHITAQEVITGKEVAAYFTNEFNRSFYYYGELSSAGGMELDNRFTFRGGVSLGLSRDITDIRGFTSAGLSPLFLKQLQFTLAYIYNGLPEYSAHSHTILPVVSFNGKWAGIGIGPGLRFTSYFGEPALFESVLSFSGYVNVINNKTMLMGISCANFNEFSVRNMGAYSLNFYSSVRINQNWSVINELELMQSGSVALSSIFHGIAWKGGLQFKW